MTLSEVFDNQSIVLYYPFSCTDFAIVNPLSEGITHPPTHEQLFVFCSVDIPKQISVADGEQTNMSYYPIENLENKLGLAGLEILSLDAIDEEPNMMYYTFTNGIRLLFVKDDAFRFARTMKALLLTNYNVYLVINGCGEFKNIIPLVRMFHQSTSLTTTKTLTDFMVVQDIYQDALADYFNTISPGLYTVKEEWFKLPHRTIFRYHSDSKSLSDFKLLQRVFKSLHINGI